MAEGGGGGAEERAESDASGEGPPQQQQQQQQQQQLETEVVHRYCHVYRRGELEDLCSRYRSLACARVTFNYIDARLQRGALPY